MFSGLTRDLLELQGAKGPALCVCTHARGEHDVQPTVYGTRWGSELRGRRCAFIIGVDQEGKPLRCPCTHYFPQGKMGHR